MFLTDFAQFGAGWPVWLAAAGLLIMLSLLVAIPLLRRPQAAQLLARSFMHGSTLQSRLLVGFRFVAVVPLLTLLPLLAVISTVTVQDTQLPQIERLAESIATSVPRLVRSRVSGIESLAGHIAAAGQSDDASLRDALLRHHTSSQEFASLWIARPTGDVIAATAISDGLATSWSGPVAGVAMMDSFKRAVIAGERYVSPVEKGAADAAPMLFVSAPVALNGNPRWGFVQGLLNLRTVVDGLISQGTVDSVSVVITDQHNRIILSSPGLALAPFSDLSTHPLITAASAEESGNTYGFSGIVSNDGRTARYLAVDRPLENGWHVYALATRAKADLTLLIYMSLGLAWALLAFVLARVITPLYGQAVAQPLQRLEESLDAFDAERTISIIPPAPNDAPQEIRQTYARVRESMRNSRDAYRNMLKAVNEGIELRQQLRGVNGENDAGTPGRSVAGKQSSGPADLVLAKVPATPEATWIGRIDTVTELSGLDVFEGFFSEAWTLAITDSRPMSVVLACIGATDEQTLKLVAQKFKSTTGRTLDLVARIGAWEFGIILPDTDLKGGLTVAEKIRGVLHSEISGQPVEISFGVASIMPNIKGNAKSFLDMCHRALATAHREDDGQIVFVNEQGKLAVLPRADQINWNPGEEASA